MVSTSDLRFARRVFGAAGVLGLLALVPVVFMEDAMTAFLPPALTHPEHFYGFLMVAIAWQVAFLVLARDPERLRPLMPVAILEKVLYVGSQAAMVATGRAALPLLGVVAIDGTFALLFLAAWRRTRSR